MKGYKWHTVATLAVVVLRLALPVAAAIAAGGDPLVALLAALGVEAGLADRPSVS